MITPEDILNIDTKTISIEAIESRLDESILHNHSTHSYEEANITDVMPNTIAAAIAIRYIEVGWNYVYYRIDREFCYTSFILSLIDPDCISTRFKGYIKLCRNNIGGQII